MSSRGFPNWEDIYRTDAVESMPWYYPGLDPDLERALGEHAITKGRALDLGTGSGTQAFALAQRGLEVTASDLSAAAIAKAKALGAAKGFEVQFIQDDILNSQLESGFDVVLDRGCYHVFAPQMRERYVQTVASLIRPSGLLFLKCFSDEQPGDAGPYRFHPEEIEATFGAAFEVRSIARTVYQGQFVPPPKALFCTLSRARSELR